MQNKSKFLNRCFEAYIGEVNGVKFQILTSKFTAFNSNCSVEGTVHFLTIINFSGYYIFNINSKCTKTVQFLRKAPNIKETNIYEKTHFHMNYLIIFKLKIY